MTAPTRFAIALLTLLAATLPASTAGAEPTAAEQSRQASEARLTAALEAQGAERAAELALRGLAGTPAAVAPSATHAAEANGSAPPQRLTLGGKAPTANRELFMPVSSHTAPGENGALASRMSCQHGYYQGSLICRVSAKRP